MRRILILLVAIASVLVLTSASALATITRRAESPPVSTTLPTISGTAQEEQTLSAANGTWSGATPMSYTYQWQRCNSSGSSCGPIAAATDQNYVASSGDLDATI